MMKLLMKCLAKAMDETFTEAFGKDWFAAFFKDDQTYPKSMRICQYNVKRERYPQNIRELDFQGYIKILSFRDTYTKVLFERYPISSSADPAVMEKEQERLQEILKRLRRDFRNSAFAHVTLEDYMEQEQGGAVESLYSMEEVAQDIKTLSRIFRTVTDENGRSYYDLIAEDIARQVLGMDKKPAASRRVSLQWICRKEQLGVTPEQLYRGCVQLGLSVSRSGDQWFLETAQYAADVAPLREWAAQEYKQLAAKKKRQKKTALVAGILGAAVITAVAMIGCGGILGKEMVVDPLVGFFRNKAMPTVADIDGEKAQPPAIPGVDSEQLRRNIEHMIDEHRGVPDRILPVNGTVAFASSQDTYIYIDRPDVVTMGDGNFKGVAIGQAYVVTVDASGECLYAELIQVI